jgi:hypothetical protein
MTAFFLRKLFQITCTIAVRKEKIRCVFVFTIRRKRIKFFSHFAKKYVSIMSKYFFLEYWMTVTFGTERVIQYSIKETLGHERKRNVLHFFCSHLTRTTSRRISYLDRNVVVVVERDVTSVDGTSLFILYCRSSPSSPIATNRHHSVERVSPSRVHWKVAFLFSVATSQRSPNTRPSSLARDIV